MDSVDLNTTTAANSLIFPATTSITTPTTRPVTPTNDDTLPLPSFESLGPGQFITDSLLSADSLASVCSSASLDNSLPPEGAPEKPLGRDTMTRTGGEYSFEIFPTTRPVPSELAILYAQRYLLVAATFEIQDHLTNTWPPKQGERTKYRNLQAQLADLENRLSCIDSALMERQYESALRQIYPSLAC
ncbi:hypothetical protein H4R33_000198 [Dimargaris cristalligena]|uniref:Uncharacterized protein n=1 Tax=Dimargaris cristalligena TaxID=215637 RepID=A0A4P9ZRL9_9FUNG|nr:hypothetical protein H4R33_000198 [Dimargaris cristalligena]RKP36103.1 hypothetical protein BJ085DRAFT_35830 [Dimargaris cristalligena]|eukprot:RKP36103.1 hypothetical protein BJ085DRAFT_35830 [Dimargaris cristalligena]